MANSVVILHGWSDTSKSFRNLAGFLTDQGFDVVDLWLGDYISMDDDVTIADVAKRMEAVITDHVASGKLSRTFDMVVHSTGGLVARRWIVDFYADRNRRCPLKRLLMLAPANHGSPLASMGKSMIGRIFKGARNFFHTGTEMLNGLELASPFQWDLVQRDIFSDEPGAPAVYGFGAGLVSPFVIVGSHPYGGMRRIVNENGGSDGTVRVAAANMNAHGLTLDFSRSPDGAEPLPAPWNRRSGDQLFPFAVLPERDHSTIIDPAGDGVPVNGELSGRLGRMIVEALRCGSAKSYANIAQAWKRISDDTALLAKDDGPREQVFRDAKSVRPEYFHQYFQVNVLVEDDQGQPVPDFFLEFFPVERRWREEGVYFHNEVLEDVHNNSKSGERRCLFIDRFDLMNTFYKKIKRPEHKVLNASISAAAPGPNSAYFSNSDMTARGHVTIHEYANSAPPEDSSAQTVETRWEENFLKRNCTHYVKIIIPREPMARVFRLSPYQP